MSARITLGLLLLWTSLGLTTPARADNFAHTQQLLSTKECKGCNLSQVGLVFAGLSGADLSEANLRNANLSRADLSGVDLSGADLSGASLAGANLTGANLAGANLRGADLRDALLIDTDLTGANLEYAFMQGAVGLPDTIDDDKARDFHSWGVSSARQGHHREALRYYNQAVEIDPEFAPTYLGRSISLYSLGNADGAMQDAQRASLLFAAQDNARGQEISQTFMEAMEADQEEASKARKRGSGFFGNLAGLVQSVTPLLFRFLIPSP